MLKQFLTTAFGGPTKWSNKNVQETLKDLKFDEVPFNLVSEVLTASIVQAGISKFVIDEVASFSVTESQSVNNMTNVILNQYADKSKIREICILGE